MNAPHIQPDAAAARWARDAAKGVGARGFGTRPDGIGRGVRVSLGTKLCAGLVFVACIGIVASGALVDRNVRAAAQAQMEDRLAYETTMLGQMTAGALFGNIDPKDTSLQESVKALGAAVQTRLTVIAENGVVVADSASNSPLSLVSEASAPEIVASRWRGSGVAVRDGRVFVARAIVRGGRRIGFARSSVSTEGVWVQVRAVRLRMIYGALVAALVAMILAYAIASKIVQPLRALFVRTRRVAAGDFGRSLRATTGDEIGDLTTAFDDMTANLGQRVRELDARNQDMRLVLDNVNQGLVAIDAQGLVSAERSAVLQTWFGPAETGITFWNYLSGVDARAGGMFQCAWEALVNDEMPFEVAFDQLPRRASSRHREWDLEYTPIRTGDRR